MGWDVPMLGNIASYDRIVAQAEGGATEGYYAVTSFNLAYENSAEGKAKEWLQRYVKESGEAPPASAQLGYISADIIIRVLEDAGPDLTVEKLISTLEQFSDYQDIFGGPTISFSPDNHIGTSQALVAQV